MTDNVIACETYLYRNFSVDFNMETTRYLTDILYNTTERVKRYLRYNHALGGGVYGVEEEEIIESACEFDVSEALGAQ